jgi:hypothetical protein
MNLDEVFSVNFLMSLGYVTLTSSIITIIIMELVKLILKKTGKLNDEVSKEAQDELLSLWGRVTSLLVYSSLYLLNDYLTTKEVIFNEALIIGLLSGGTLTLTTAKGIYTAIRQHIKKKEELKQLRAISKTSLLKEEAMTNNKEPQPAIIIKNKGAQHD